MAAVGEGEIVAALADPAFYPHRPARVRHVQTHISHVFLAGPLVYKLKKGVRFAFLDFSTLELRRVACEEEVRLNARLAPGVYLGVVRVTRSPTGALALDGGGEVVAHVVSMRCLPDDRMLDRLLARDAVPSDLIDRLAGRVAEFHARAPTDSAVAAEAAPEALRVRFEENLTSVDGFAGRILAPEDHEVLRDFGSSFVARHDSLLRVRQDAGRIREGHGDLHAEHVCDLVEPLPAVPGRAPLGAGIYVFDCIEFSSAFRANDVASEVAFLAMDLERRGRPDLATRFVDAYVGASGDPDVARLVPFYACYRACVRGKVAALKSVDREVAAEERVAAMDRARGYFAQAVRHAWQAGDPVVVACCGLSGSGKTAMADALAGATGFAHVATDVLRRRGHPANRDLYTPAARDATYEALAEEVERLLAAGRSVIADATFLRRTHRDRIASLAARQRRRYVFLECVAGEAVARRRLDARGPASISDARWETYMEQREVWEVLGRDEPHVLLTTSGSVSSGRAAAVRALWAWRQGRYDPSHRHGVPKA